MCKLHGMAKRNETGKDGESVARAFLEKQGYKITHTNWHWHHYELDIVAVKDTWLVVVEVKTRSDDYLLAPEDAVDAPKIRRIVAAADAYVRFFNLELPVRFDIITVIKKGEESEIDHIEDAFYFRLLSFFDYGYDVKKGEESEIDHIEDAFYAPCRK